MSHFSDIELQQEYENGIHDPVIDHDDFTGLKFELSLLQFSVKKLIKSIETGEKRDEIFNDLEVIKDCINLSDGKIKALAFLSDNPVITIQ